MPAVSIIMPVFNAERYMAQCFESVFTQTFNDFEVICIDDGSTDGSPRLLETYARRDDRIRVLRQENRGAAAARNAGMDVAAGEYFAFLDADDYAAPEFLEKAYGKAKAVEADIVGFGNYHIRDGQAPVPNRWGLRDYIIPPDKEIFSYRDLPDSILDAIAPAPWNKLYRAAMINEARIRFQPLAAFNDVYFCTVVLALAERITCIWEPLIYYRVGGSSSITSKKIEHFDCLRQAEKAVVEYCRRLPHYELIKPAVANFAVNNYLYYINDILLPTVQNQSLEKRWQALSSSMDNHVATHAVKVSLRGASAALLGPLRFLLRRLYSLNYLTMTPEQRMFVRRRDQIYSIFQSEFFRDVDVASLYPYLQKPFKKMRRYNYADERYAFFIGQLQRLPQAAGSGLLRLFGGGRQPSAASQPPSAVLSKNDAALHKELEHCRERAEKAEQLFVAYAAPVREKSALLVEPNNCHGEVLPGLTRYLLDLGYNVDVLITLPQSKKNPLCRIADARVRVFALPWDAIGTMIQSDKMAAYEVLLLSSYTMYKWLGEKTHPAVTEHFPHIASAKKGTFFVAHHVQLVPRSLLKARRVIALADIQTEGPAPIVVNPHYFGDTAVSAKADDVTHFILVGAMEKERRNCDQLLDAVRSLARSGCTRFDITVIGRGSADWIAGDVRPYFHVMGETDFPSMYAAMENADFFLSLLDPDDPKHARYLTTATSGSFQLIRGFCTPGIMARIFAEARGFSDKDTVLYEKGQDLADAMRAAVEMSPENYAAMQAALRCNADALYQTSLKNLEDMLAQPCSGTISDTL